MNIDLTQRLCPRCETRPVAAFPGDVGAISRTTRRDGTAIRICSCCGDAEVRLERAGRLQHFADWALSEDEREREHEEWTRLQEAAEARLGLNANSAASRSQA
jgi:hypothetical protein